MATKIIRTWETVFFTSSKKGVESQTVELTINRSSGSFDLCTSREEAVSFKKDTLEEAKLKLEAVAAAIKYADQELKSIES